jgi:hypothetical protein
MPITALARVILFLQHYREHPHMDCSLLVVKLSLLCVTGGPNQLGLEEYV